MKLDETSATPLFLQISEELENAILSGAYQEGDQVPSTTELSLGYQINPATALKGVNQLVDEGILFKRRGIGVFVKKGALAKIRSKRTAEFKQNFLNPLLIEARRLNITKAEIIEILKEETSDGKN